MLPTDDADHTDLKGDLQGVVRLTLLFSSILADSVCSACFVGQTLPRA